MRRPEYSRTPPGHSAGRTEPPRVGVSYDHRAAAFGAGARILETDLPAGAASVSGRPRG